MLPAYLPNPAAALFGGGTPIDFGRNYPDGHRIFGDGKTCRGFLMGILLGIVIGWIEIWARGAYGLTRLPEQTFTSIVVLSVGALLGDLAKSFFKRRLGKDRGAKWPVADMYDLVAGALILMLIVNSSWIVANITIPVLLFILILTPILHRSVNIIGYLLHVKEVPW
ncbi:MAG: CDP-2,3-bis-(O-geranylgeranyl)-sn-glycerol synthase [Methanoregula sp. SKADARSKE-2]|nr:MAG: CDP-2,3-bis-(O-geranylgeranyl)-sn-glycerol synthase [Methanoregula sp. SKADARSKE-2]